MKVSALFADYDGTLAPADVSREQSEVPSALSSVLQRISSKIPVAVVTSKDLAFVKPKTAFAWGWATALGLEVRLRDGSGRLSRVPGTLADVLATVKGSFPSEVVVEEKRGSDGTLLGASLDWSRAPKAPEREIGEAARAFAAGGFQTFTDQEGRYLDVYASSTDKGTALKALVKMLGVSGMVMYLGDTEPDNAAFDASDIPVCVEHGQSTDGLRFRYAVRYSQLALVLSDLLESRFEFLATQPFLRGRSQSS